MRHIVGVIFSIFVSVVSLSGGTACASPEEGAPPPTQAKSSAPVPLAIGDTAPDFELSDQDGKSVKLSAFHGKYVVLQWTNSQCPFVQRHYKLNTTNNLVANWGKKNVVFLAIDSSNFVTQAALKQTSTEKQTAYPLLNDSSGATGMEYGAKSTPHVFIISPDGKLVYQGAMDNDAYGDMGDGRVNYVDQALTELFSKRAVSFPTTASYGCSVKYKAS